MKAFSQTLPLPLLLLLALTAAECAIANGCREVPLSGRAVAALAPAGTSIHAGPHPLGHHRGRGPAQLAVHPGLPEAVALEKRQK